MGINIGSHDAIDPDDFAPLQSHGLSTAVGNDDLIHLCIGADLAAICLQYVGEGLRDLVHSAPDNADANVLHGTGEKPGELRTKGVVGGQRGVESAASKEVLDFGRREVLVDPGTRALEMETIAVDDFRARELHRQGSRWRIHLSDNCGLCLEISLVELAPSFPVLPRKLRDASDRCLQSSTNS